MLSISKSTVENAINPIGIEEKNPRISWKFSSSNQNVLQSAYLIQVSDNERFEHEFIWDSGKIESEQSLYISYEGKELQSRTKYYYRIKIWDNHGEQSEWSEVYFWEMGLLEEWKANWITPKINDKKKKPHLVFYFRKKFFNNKPISKARIYASALGLYEIHLNGRRVGDEYFTPGFTVYKKHVQYQVYDVPVGSISNQNVIGVILSEGWYRGKLMSAIGNRRKLGAIIFQMILSHPDGTETLVTTDENTWKVNIGPIIESGIYDGELYDANLEVPWLESDFDDSSWSGVEKHQVDIPNFNFSLGEKVRKINEITPIEIINGPDGSKILNMGQNMVGWLRLRLKNTKPGQKILIKHGELMDGKDIYTKNLRDAKARLEYICKGAEEEIYEPSFTFMGFQFAKIVGYENITLETVTGVVIHSDMRKIGSFECSHPLINKLQENIEWGLKGNFLDIPTDCPQRNERLGWTGDANVFSPTANFIMDTNRFFTKWLKDLRLDQHEKNGSIPPVIPNVFPTSLFNGATGWADVATMLPWQLYLDYGDEKILEVQYESMKKWVDHYQRRAEKHHRRRNKNLRQVNKEIDKYIITSGPQFFGDWLAPNIKKNGWFSRTKWIATAWYAHSTNILAKSAKIIGKKQDAEYYRNLFEKIRHAFKVKFLEPNGSIYKGFQTIYANALFFDIIPEELKAKTARILAEDVKKNDNHLTTGFLGTPYLTFALSENDQLETAYNLLLQETCPSWLYPVLKGATTIWERWDGIFESGAINRGGINDPNDMCSFNHYAYGAIGDWLYKIVAGINYDENVPGYKHIMIKPKPGGGLTHVHASLESRYGLINSKWKLENGTFTLNVVIPPNTTATVKLPDVSEEITVGSGTYEYSCRLP